LTEQHSINTELFEKIKSFVEKARWKYNFPLTRETKLTQNLRIAGKDGVDFIVAFGKEFKVDVSEFMAADYFEPEGMNWLIPKSGKVTKDLTLGHLEKAVKAGKLNESVINSN
jgi:acyl carrier protein